MLLFWRIRYLDTRDKQFKDRDLWLETDALDPVTKAAVEATHELKDTGRARDMLRYRNLFQEKNPGDQLNNSCARPGGMGWVFLDDYFEDESGQQLTHKRIALVLTGNPDAELFPHGTKQHDVAYIQADKRPIPIDKVIVSEDELNVMGYFTRDLHELLECAFYKDGPGTLSGPGSGGHWVLRTSVSDEEIRSFITIFRRLYMEREPANFVKAVSAFSGPLYGYPLANWVQGVASEYAKALESQPDFSPLIGQVTLPFSRKRLIDVFVYTQYAHQPDERRSRQFQECLTSVRGNRPLLTWLFLTEVWKCALHMRNAGVVIAEFYDHYCRCHNVPCRVLASLRSEHPELGTLEKKQARQARVLRAKAESLAKAIWESAGRPEGGHAQFVDQAFKQLIEAIGDSSK